MVVYLGRTLIAVAALAFVLAVLATLLPGGALGLPPESFSRACTNLALIAIGIALTGPRGSTPDK